MKGRLKIVALLGLKVVIASCFFYYLSIQVDWKEVMGTLVKITWKTTLILTLGSACGWLIEGWRWFGHIEHPKFSFLKAVRSVGAGMTVAMFMPGGVGSITSRVLQLPKDRMVDQWKLVTQATFWQWSAVWHLGLLAYAWRAQLLALSPWPWLLMAMISLTIALFFLQPFSYKTGKWLSWVAFPKAGVGLLYWAMLRYLVYALFLWIGLTQSPSIPILPFSYFVPLVVLSFSIQFVAPTIPLLDLGVRSSVMLWVFEPFYTHHSDIVIWAFLLWFFNQLVPAIIGVFSGWIWFSKS